MGWFDEQIKQRMISDDELFAEAFYEIADSVTGRHLAKTLMRDREKTHGAIADILLSYGCKPKESSADFDDIHDEIEFMCRPCGVMHRSVQLEDAWYRDAFCAYLATDSRTDEVTALIPDRLSGRYRYFDRSSGKYIRIGKKLAPFFNGDAICFYKPLPLRPLKAKDIFRYGISAWSRRDLILPRVLMLTATVIGLLVPKLNHFLLGEVYELQNQRFLISTVIFLACLCLSRLLFQTLQTLFIAKNSVKSSLSVEAAVMMRVLSLPAVFFRQFSSGEITQRIKYANELCSILIEVFFGSALLSLFSLVYIFQMFRYGPALLLPSVAMLLVTVLFSVLTTLIGIRCSKKRMEAEARESGIAYALIAGVQKIKLSGAEKRAFARWGHSYAEVSEHTYNEPSILKLRNVIPLIFSYGGLFLIYYFAVKSSISVADYYAFNTAYAMVFGAFSALLSLADRIAELKPTIEMVKPILDAQPEVSEGKTLITGLSGNIELNNVSFSYTDTMPPVLNNLSLKIRAGQYIAIVGKTGCGKSTLLRILLGFETPDRGAVYYDGRDLSTIDLKSLRRNIGTVMQDGKLFQGDIFSNITVSAPHLTLDEAWEAAEMAGIADDIRRMPMGMQTLITEGSGGISGGQRQRLMIARAIAPKPNILLFDEATSALDNITQKTVSDALDSLHCTRIVIAHRLSTIRHCDRIIFLDGGKIAEDGSYDELIAKNGLFAELVNRQRLEKESPAEAPSV